MRTSLRCRLGLALATVPLGGLGLLTACGNATVPVDPTGTPSAVPTSTDPAPTDPAPTDPASPGSSPTAGTEVVEVDGRQVEVPVGLTFPDDAVVSTTFTGTVILTAPTPADVLAFYRRALPTAGYQIDTDVSDTLGWSGRGFGGTVVASSSDTTITYGPSTSASPEASTPDASTPSEEPGMLTPADLGVINAPFFFRFPADAKITKLSDPPSGASFTLTTPGPADVLAFYRTTLPVGHFTITDEQTDAGTTTITFTDSDGWQGTLRMGPDTSTASFVAPTADKTLTGRDVGVSHLPFHFRFPADTKLTGITDPATGASFTFASPSGKDVVAYYRAHLSPHFEITKDSVRGGDTVLDFADVDEGWTGTITVSDGRATVRFTAP